MWMMRRWTGAWPDGDMRLRTLAQPLPYENETRPDVAVREKERRGSKSDKSGSPSPDTTRDKHLASRLALARPEGIIDGRAREYRKARPRYIAAMDEINGGRPDCPTMRPTVRCLGSGRGA